MSRRRQQVDLWSVAGPQPGAFGHRFDGYAPPMHSARRAAPEIDRLVLAVNGALGKGDEVLVREAGLSEPGFVRGFADWLLTVGLEREVANGRIPYAASGSVDTWLDEAAAAGAIELRDGRFFATDRLVPFATSIMDRRAAVAAGMWGRHTQEIATVTVGLRAMIAAAPSEFRVATSHCEIPEPADRYLAAHQRLTTMRYIRAHAHISAWRDAELTPFEIVAMTGLWRGGRNGGIPGSLVQRGYADPDGLTEEGEMVRQEIEIVTNQRVQPVFDVLDDPEPFLAALEALPSETDDF